MADGPLHQAMRRTLLRLQDMTDLTDGQLLERFASQRDESAFETLVRRHGPMVLRVCRRVLRDPHDAEEAFQATFIVLVRKAGSISRGDLVGGWLHGVASRIALKSRTQANQRKAQVQPVEPATLQSLAQAPTSDESSARELRPLLDEELDRLPEKYRTPMVLCYLEGKSHAEAAKQLGWARWTTATRLSRGRNLLRRRLNRRGLTLSALALTTLLTQEAVAASEPGAAVVVLSLSATGQAAGTAAEGLAEAVIQTFFWSKLKLGLAMTAAACLLLVSGVTVAWLVSRPAVDEPASTQPIRDNRLGVNASVERRPFPDDNPWNQVIADEPVDANSDALIARIGLDKPLQPRFGAGAHGIPYVVVSGQQAAVPVCFRYEAESDVGPYPIPAAAPMETGLPEDRTMVILDRDHWKLYEMLAPAKHEDGWRATSGAVFDLNSNQLRPWGSTSADGAGLPIFPGLVRWDEVERQEIRHALRFTVRQTRRAFVAPARHYASNMKDADLAPMGLRVRLKADYDISGFPPAAQIILTALKRYGMFVAGHGPDWGLSGTADPRWNDADLRTLGRVQGQDFEVIRLGRIHATELPPRDER